MTNKRIVLLISVVTIIFSLSFSSEGWTSDSNKTTKQQINNIEKKLNKLEKRVEKLEKDKTKNITSVRPKIRWKERTGIQSWRNNPIILGKYLFVPSSGKLWNEPDWLDGVHAFDIETGKKLWFIHSKNDFNSICYMEGLIVGGSDSGEVFAISHNTGKVKWKKQFDSKVYATPCYAGGSALIATGKGELFLLDLNTGNQRDKKILAGSVRGSMALKGNDIWVTTENGYIYDIFCFGSLSISWKGRVYFPDQYGNYRDEDNYITGTSDFSYLNEGGFSIACFYGAPVIFDDRVIMGFVRDTYYSYPPLVAIESRKHKILWFGSDKKGIFKKENETFGNLRNTPAIYKNLLICGNPYSNKIYAVSARDGTLVWNTSIGQPMFQHWSSPVVNGEYVYIGRHDGYLHKLKAKNGKRVWSVFLGKKEEAPIEQKIEALRTKYSTEILTIIINTTD